MSSDPNFSEAPAYQDAPPPPADPGSADNSAEGGPQAAPGMGQSKSSRRRRRKRKTKAIPAQQGQPGEAGAPQLDLDGQSTPQAAPASQPQQQNNPQQGQQGSQGQQNQGSGKRWKKKFRDRQRQQVGDPGNSFQPGNTSGGSNFGGGGGSNFKRKGKQRKERSFVGPMDHSYRVANGNFADAPPSTIELRGGSGNGNGHGHSHGGHGGPRYSGDSQPIDYSQGRSIPIPEGTPTKIYFFIEDLFFYAKINETARKLGVKISFIKNEKEKDIVAELAEMDENHRPALIVFDLNNVSAKPLTLIPKLKAKLKRSASIIGFLSHIQGDLKAKAMEAGCDTVMPRSAFSQNLPNLLRRYSAEPEEDQNFNQ